MIFKLIILIYGEKKPKIKEKFVEKSLWKNK